MSLKNLPKTRFYYARKGNSVRLALVFTFLTRSACFCSELLTSLRSRLSPTRTTLLTTLSGIFPIELLSPPDLLYTILSVPLPIPLSSTDPAPPLLLPSQKEVTEDGVATALGFAAQVVHMMAVYQSKVLVYPITCVGSRSLIKDNISAMVGPKM